MTTRTDLEDKPRTQLDQEIDEILQDDANAGITNWPAFPMPDMPEPSRPKRRARAAPGTRARVRAKTKARPKAKTRAKKATPRRKRSTQKVTRKKATAKKKSTPRRKAGKKAGKKAKAKRAPESPRSSRSTIGGLASAPSAPHVVEPLAAVLGAVEAMPARGRFGDKVFISEIWRRVGRDIGMSLPELKRWLIGQNRERHLDLARADLVGAMDPQQVAESEIQDMGSTFHFVIDRAAARRR